MNEQETWSAGYRAGWEARDQAAPLAWNHRGWRRGRFGVPIFALVPVLVVIAIATHTWWVLLGIPVLWLVTAPLRRRRWARGNWAC